MCLLKLETSVNKGLKAKRFKTALATDYADKVFQLVFYAHVILPWQGDLYDECR
ncbi:hypothetical protein [Algibacillus agarilyticus]|uniref:hypothetical protein n=1 Tax=Algibacillus agarilyticus TaxID=2234133 RepID=UPI00130035E3|nr:hypothetical protein [Algibacillus agarilyticus]